MKINELVKANLQLTNNAYKSLNAQRIELLKTVDEKTKNVLLAVEVVNNAAVVANRKKKTKMNSGQKAAYRRGLWYLRIHGYTYTDIAFVMEVNNDRELQTFLKFIQRGLPLRTKFLDSLPSSDLEAIRDAVNRELYFKVMNAIAPSSVSSGDDSDMDLGFDIG